MKKLSIILFIISFNSWANCHIDVWPYSLFGNNSSVNFIRHSECSETINQTFKQLIDGKTGRLFSRHLASILSEQFHQKITITPRQFHLINICQTVIAKHLPKNQKLKKCNIKFNDQTINQETPPLLTLTTQPKPGKHTIGINLSNSQKLWADIHIQTKIKALITTKALMPYTPLHNIRKQISWVDNPQDYLTDLQHLEFYQTTKALPANTPIRYRDIHPLTIVKAGTPTKVIVKNGNITLTTIALPYENGKFGDQVTLRNIKSGKKLVGQVININQVVIRL